MKKETILHTTSSFARFNVRLMFLAALAAMLLLAAALPILRGVSAQAQDDRKETPCSFKLSDVSADFGSEGGNGKLIIYSSGKGCVWTAETKDNFISFVSKPEGVGDGELVYEVAENPDYLPRGGEIHVGGQTLTINQDGRLPPPESLLNTTQPPEPEGCVLGLSPAEIDAPPAGAEFTIEVDAPGDCLWTAQSNAAWLMPDDKANSGKGKGDITLTVAPNHNPTARVAFVDIGGQTLTVTQNSLVNLPIVKFKKALTDTQEDQTARLEVVREGDASGVSSVAYATMDSFAAAACDPAGNSPGFTRASQRCDYTVTRGTLTFQPGETEKSFAVLITDDAYAEVHESLGVALVGAQNANFGDQRTTMLLLHDNDAEGSGQPLEDVNFFVTQHYADFLNRAPDPGGLNYWMGEILSCGGDAACVAARRVGVSNAFFFEPEFQQTGAFVYRLYRAAYGATRPKYKEFVADRAQLATGPDLAANKSALAEDFTARPEFLARYPATLSGAEFINRLLANILQHSGVDLSAQTPVLLALYDLGGPAVVLRELADERPDNNPINNRAWLDAEYNPSFVLTQYFGYLRRNPDPEGYNFWLNLVNQYPLRDPRGQNGMVCAFITSAEYQLRFGPDTPRSNAECTP
jgi:hypothetical protein